MSYLTNLGHGMKKSTAVLSHPDLRTSFDPTFTSEDFAKKLLDDVKSVSVLYDHALYIFMYLCFCLGN